MQISGRDILERLKERLKQNFPDNLLRSVFDSWHQFSLLEAHQDTQFIEKLKQHYAVDEIEAKMRLFEDIFIELAALVLTDIGLMKPEGGEIPLTVFVGTSPATKEILVVLFDNNTERVVHSFRINELDRNIWEKELERAYEDIGSFYLTGKKYELSEPQLKAFAYKVIRHYMKYGEINWEILKTEIFDLKSD